MKLYKYRFISLVILLFAFANVQAQSIGSPNSTIVDLGKFKLNKTDTVTALPTFVYVPKNDTFAKYRTDSLLNHASGNGNPNSNIGSGYRWAIPNTNNIKTYHAGLGFIIDSTAHANELTGIVDTAYLNSLYTSADTANFSVPDYLDSTGATQWRPLISLPNRKIGTSSKYVVDTTKFKLVINNKNVSFGGNRVNLSVSGNAFTSGFDSAGSFKKTGGTSSQFLKADGSVDANTYLTSTDLSGYTPITRTISTTAPLTGGGDLSANRTLAITQATTSTNGYLSSTDWNTFNGKQNAITTGTTAQYFRGDLSLATFPTTVSTFTNDAGYLTNTTGDTRYLKQSNNLSDVASAATARTNLGATTVGANLFTLTNPSAIRYVQINADNSITLNSANAHLNALLPSQTGNNTKFLQTDGTNTSWATAAGGVTAGDTSTLNVHTTPYNNTQYVRLDGSYADPTWLTSLNWNKLTGTPTSLTFNGDQILGYHGNAVGTYRPSYKYIFRSWDNTIPLDFYIQQDSSHLSVGQQDLNFVSYDNTKILTLSYGGNAGMYLNSGLFSISSSAPQVKLTKGAGGFGSIEFYGPARDWTINDFNDASLHIAHNDGVYFNDFVITQAGQIGLSISSPTANLQLKPGFAFVGGAPLKFSKISVPTTSATGNGTTATITYINVGLTPFAVGSTIKVSGVTPSGYNGTFTVTASNATTVSFANATTAAQTVAGTIVSAALLATPEAGAVEYDTTNFYGTVGTTRYYLTRTLSNTASLDFSSTAAGTSTDLTITVTGAADGDPVTVGVPNASTNANSSFTAWVSAANTVTIRFNNYSSGSIDPTSGTFRVAVLKY